jgi:hypothetical protein
VKRPTVIMMMLIRTDHERGLMVKVVVCSGVREAGVTTCQRAAA